MTVQGPPDDYTDQLNERAAAYLSSVTPATCPHCEYDRRIAGLERGGWVQHDNNGPIKPCGWCNPDGEFPRD